MLERIADLDGTRLDVAAYLNDFWKHFHGPIDVAKLERRQTFREPGDPSWEAFVAGNWADAVRLIDENRDVIAKEVRENPGTAFRRVRVVERPYSPYLRWELYYIRHRAEAGEDIRVLDAGELRFLEGDRTVPELVVVGDSVAYEVCYDDSGNLIGARRFLDADIIGRCSEDISDLLDRSEALRDFLRREPSALPPPET